MLVSRAIQGQQAAHCEQHEERALCQRDYRRSPLHRGGRRNEELRALPAQQLLPANCSERGSLKRLRHKRFPSLSLPGHFRFGSRQGTGRGGLSIETDRQLSVKERRCREARAPTTLLLHGHCSFSQHLPVFLLCH